MHAKKADISTINVLKGKKSFRFIWEGLWHLTTVHKSEKNGGENKTAINRQQGSQATGIVNLKEKVSNLMSLSASFTLLPYSQSFIFNQIPAPLTWISFLV